MDLIPKLITSVSHPSGSTADRRGGRPPLKEARDVSVPRRVQLVVQSCGSSPSRVPTPRGSRRGRNEVQIVAGCDGFQSALSELINPDAGSPSQPKVFSLGFFKKRGPRQGGVSCRGGAPKVKANCFPSATGGASLLDTFRRSHSCTQRL